MDKTRHNARKNSGRHIPIEKLWERCGGICWLCHDYVDLELGEATRDHVIPFAQGGTGGWDNIRLAHEQCNLLRGNPSSDAVVRDVILSRVDVVN